jgi:membrane fusion protein (multidrug efflux system)
VFVIRPDEQGRPRAWMQSVNAGPTAGGLALIQEGLEVGERVAASGSFKLRDGVLVAFTPPPADAQKGQGRTPGNGH